MRDLDPFAGRTRRSRNWLLGAFVVCSALGAFAGGYLLKASGGSPLPAVFLAPGIAGVVLIGRAYSEGCLAGRAQARAATPAEPS